jgi:aldehyde dehydrogenase (NAD+)
MSNVAEIFDTMSYGPAPEADTAARAWLASHSARFGLFINGAWIQPREEGAFLESRNPATGETLARIAVAGPKEVDAAVAAAAAAAPVWAKRRGHERSRVL